MTVKISNVVKPGDVLMDSDSTELLYVVQNPYKHL